MKKIWLSVLLSVAACSNDDAAPAPTAPVEAGAAPVAKPPFADSDLRSFSGTYRAKGTSSDACDGTSFGFTGYEPAVPGTYPVFVYTCGTASGKSGTAWDTEEAKLHAREMARRGFVAVSVGYENGTIPASCDELDTKAACIYRDAPDSALHAACTRPGAACTEKGVVVAGESQGAMIAARSQNFAIAGEVKGAWLRSIVDVAFYQECIDGGSTRQLPNASVWATNGASDNTPGTGLDTLQRVTGWPEDDVTSRSSDAEHGGYFQVQDSDLQPGRPRGADHTFHRLEGRDAGWDANWAPPSKTPWSLATSLDWLDRRVVH